MILGMDISTSCTGFCVLDDNAKIKNLSYVDLSKKKTTETTKDQVLRQVKDEIGDAFDFPTKILKSGPRKGLEVTNKVSYDMADAYVIAKANWIEKNKKT